MRSSTQHKALFFCSDVGIITALREDFRAGMQQMKNLIARLTVVQEGVINMLAYLDDDRPPAIRKLNNQ